MTLSYDLIDTQWNVNVTYLTGANKGDRDLIDTQWNVNAAQNEYSCYVSSI